MNFVLAINVGILVATLGSVLMMIDRMGKETRGAIRWGAVLLLVGIVAEVFGYFWHWESWTDTIFFGGAAMVLISNLRFQNGASGPYSEWTREQRERSIWKSNLYAYAVGALTVLGLLVSWAISFKGAS